jgi:uncharacterized coiled-coil protein SlyX
VELIRLSPDPAGGEMKIAAMKGQRRVRNALIFVPAAAAEGAGRRDVALGGESFYSLAERGKKEALPMEARREKTYSSPQRKLVKFFERSRDQWKAKAGVAKTGLKRLGTRVRRLERRKADYQHQVAALQTQVAEWQAKHAQTVQELEELKKKYPHLSGES